MKVYLLLFFVAFAWSKSIPLKVQTNLGSFEIEVYPEKAPETVKNFLKYVKEGHYKHTIFHRVIDGFMIQGGGLTQKFERKKTFSPIKNEATNKLPNKRGSLAMARTNQVDSATNQFFINVTDNPFLNHKSKNPQEYGYAVFGQVVKGMDVVDKIKTVKTTRKGQFQDVPVKTIVIEKITEIKNEKSL